MWIDQRPCSHSSFSAGVIKLPIFGGSLKQNANILEKNWVLNSAISMCIGSSHIQEYIVKVLAIWHVIYWPLETIGGLWCEKKSARRFSAGTSVFGHWRWMRIGRRWKSRFFGLAFPWHPDGWEKMFGVKKVFGISKHQLGSQIPDSKKQKVT